MSIRALPVGANTVSFSRAETAKGIEYEIKATQEGWTFTVKADTSAGVRYYLNGSSVGPSGGGIRMAGTSNHLLVVPGK